MRESVNKAIKYENSNNVSASEKEMAWQYIIDNTNDNNPYSTGDEELRRHAMERLNYWKNLKALSHKILSKMILIALRQANY